MLHVYGGMDGVGGLWVCVFVWVWVCAWVCGSAAATAHYVVEIEHYTLHAARVGVYWCIGVLVYGYGYGYGYRYGYGYGYGYRYGYGYG